MKYFFILFACLICVSCELNPPPPACVLSSQFVNLEPKSDSYKSAVISLLEISKPEDFRYFFKTFVDEGDATYMVVNVRNEVQCFDAKILVERWDKLEGMRKVNGKKYPKELVKLKWTLKDIGGQETVVYHDMNTIRD